MRTYDISCRDFWGSFRVGFFSFFSFWFIGLLFCLGFFICLFVGFFLIKRLFFFFPLYAMCLVDMKTARHPTEQLCQAVLFCSLVYEHDLTLNFDLILK